MDFKYKSQSGTLELDRRRRRDCIQIIFAAWEWMEKNSKNVTDQVKINKVRSTKSIKNLFYKTLRKSLRRITKILGSK